MFDINDILQSIYNFYIKFNLYRNSEAISTTSHIKIYKVSYNHKKDELNYIKHTLTCNNIIENCNKKTHRYFMGFFKDGNYLFEYNIKFGILDYYYYTGVLYESIFCNILIKIFHYMQFIDSDINNTNTSILKLITPNDKFIDLINNKISNMSQDNLISNILILDNKDIIFEISISDHFYNFMKINEVKNV